MTKPRRILILGRNGQLARELADLSWISGVDPVFQGRSEIDLFRLGALGERLQELAPDLIVNAVGYTQADRAELEPEAAFLLNATAPENLATAAAALGIPLIHCSSEQVFDGRKDRAYSEGDALAPICVLGESKAAGERAVARAGGRHLVLRSSWLFGRYGDNFVKSMLFMGRLRRSLGAADDQFGCPTPAAALAQAVQRIALEMLAGRTYPAILHYCGDAPTTWFRFAQEIFSLAAAHQPAPQLSAIRTAEMPARAARPRNAVLDCGLARMLGLPAADWRAALAPLVAALAAKQAAAAQPTVTEDAA